MTSFLEPCDPISCLNDEVLVHVFSFLVGPNRAREVSVAPARQGVSAEMSTKQEHSEVADDAMEVDEPIEADAAAAAASTDGDGASGAAKRVKAIPPSGPFWPVREAGQFYLVLASVSSGWKSFLDRSMRQILDNTLPLFIDWDEVEEEAAAKCVEWLCFHKHSLGRIRWICSSRDPRIQDFYCSHLMRMLKECNTTHLACVDVTIHLHFASPTFKKRASSLAYCQRQMLRQLALQNLIASQCPCLVGLGLKFVAVGDEDSSMLRSIISPALFSLPTVRYLAIVLELCRINGSVHGMFFNNLIQSLPNLNVLHLGCASNFSLQDTVMLVESSSLMDLNVEKFDQGICLHLKCPRLKRLSLRAGFKRKYRGVWEICFHQKVHRVEKTPCGCLVKISDLPFSPSAIQDVHMKLEHVVGEASVHVDLQSPQQPA